MLKYLIIIGLLLGSLFGGVLDGYAQSIDSDAFQSYRLNKVNDLRNDYDLLPYNLNNGLSLAAHNRSDYSKSLGSMSHKKYGSKLYYDYKLIAKRVEEQGVQFTDKAGTKVVENIGWGYIKCNKKDDCTNEAIKATESTWKFFMNERGKKYAPHFNSMISKQYSQAGFGLSVDRKTGRYYFTAYYSIPTNQQKLIAKNTITNPRMVRLKK